MTEKCPYQHNRNSPNEIASWKIEIVEPIGAMHTARRKHEFACDYHLPRVCRALKYFMDSTEYQELHVIEILP